MAWRPRAAREPLGASHDLRATDRADRGLPPLSSLVRLTRPDLHAARTCCQRAEAHLLRARAAWIDAEVEHAAARQRAEEASAAALRASEAPHARVLLCAVPGRVEVSGALARRPHGGARGALRPLAHLHAPVAEVEMVGGRVNAPWPLTPYCLAPWWVHVPPSRCAGYLSPPPTPWHAQPRCYAPSSGPRRGLLLHMQCGQ